MQGNSETTGERSWQEPDRREVEDLQLLQNVAYAVNAGCRKAFFVLLNVDKNQWTAFVRSTSTSAMAESNCTSAEEGYFSPLR